MPAEIRKQSHVQVIRSMLSDNVLVSLKGDHFILKQENTSQKLHYLSSKNYQNKS
jgi:hypothetical protein